jgi:hypothetical protein
VYNRARQTLLKNKNKNKKEEEKRINGFRLLYIAALELVITEMSN